ncbi:MAG TPA: hypothetical protein VHU84_13105, partial [Lacipirellulaceae bacterium]|nr:hypothetical protein [Lacipirellulaceae bacterium]
CHSIDAGLGRHGRAPRRHAEPSAGFWSPPRRQLRKLRRLPVVMQQLRSASLDLQQLRSSGPKLWLRKQLQQL